MSTDESFSARSERFSVTARATIHESYARMMGPNDRIRIAQFDCGTRSGEKGAGVNSAASVSGVGTGVSLEPILGFLLIRKVNDARLAIGTRVFDPVIVIAGLALL